MDYKCAYPAECVDSSFCEKGAGVWEDKQLNNLQLNGNEEKFDIHKNIYVVLGR